MMDFLTSIYGKYDKIKKIGEGSFGEVYLIQLKEKDNNKYNNIFALKEIRLGNMNLMEDLPFPIFNEIKSLQILDHQHIIKLFSIIPVGSMIGLITEYMNTDLSKIMRNSLLPLSIIQIKTIMKMILLGINYCHKMSIMHRDLKSSNLLINKKGLLKIADFGLATIYTQNKNNYSHQVATRWYRAPELLFGSRNYDNKVDMWSIGAIFGEMLNENVPLFIGQNDIDQIYKILQIRGSPKNKWPAIMELPDYHKIDFPEFKEIPLIEVLPDVLESSIELLEDLLQYDPSKRITAEEALNHRYFKEEPHPLLLLPMDDFVFNESFQFM